MSKDIMHLFCVEKRGLAPSRPSCRRFPREICPEIVEWDMAVEVDGRNNNNDFQLVILNSDQRKNYLYRLLTSPTY